MTKDNHTTGTPRRRFIKQSMVAGAAATLAPLASSDQANASQTANQVTGYKTLGRTGLKIADISFGSSRLRTGEEALVDHALHKGVNYFDTAESYTGGESETVIGNALKGKRDQVILASKAFIGASQSKESMMEELESSLQRLQTDYIDVYFSHAVNNVARLQNPEWQEFNDLAKQQGKIRYVGMSGHAGRLIDCLGYAIDKNLVDVMLVGYNFGQDPAFYEKITRSFDMIAKQPELPQTLAKAKAKNIGVIAMKVLMGARLNDMREHEQAGNTYAQAAFRWALSNPNVDAAIISMTSKAKIDEYLGASGASELANGDLELLKSYAALNGTTYCRHACNDCSGACPHGVPIADVLRTRMYATDYQDVDFARAEYAQLNADASPCLTCSGEPCQSACTQGIAINELCGPTHRMLA